MPGEYRVGVLIAVPKKQVIPNWQALAKQAISPDFIASDPISFPHRYRHSGDPRDAELAGFVAALFSYGRRELILQTVDRILSPLGDNPVKTLESARFSTLKKQNKGFCYRFNTAPDVVFLLARLAELYREHDSLEAAWQGIFKLNMPLAQQISTFRLLLLDSPTLEVPDTYGMRFLLADPAKNSAAKRFNMFLRWMVRNDCVDLGLWQNSLTPAQLVFPLDTHVATQARKYGLTQRNSNDWKTAEDITAYFRAIDPSDPVKFDFALFRLGLEKNSTI